MKRTILAAVALAAIAAVAAPWVIGWRTEQLVRERAAQVAADKHADVRLRIDSYRRGWRGSDAQISVVDLEGAALVTLAAAIRHWPFSDEGPADWVAVPELGPKLREALGPWGTTLPELSAYTKLSWRGDTFTRVESQPFKRRITEFAGGSLEIAALAGTVNWRRDGALTYEFALPVFRVERLAERAGASDVVEFKDARLMGQGSLGTADRRWNEKGSLAAVSVAVTEGGRTVLSAADPVLTYAAEDEGEFAGVKLTLAAKSIAARHALQELTDASVEFALEARHLAKEPLGQLMDRRTDAPMAAAALDLLRQSPEADLDLTVKAREGRVVVKVALKFDGQQLQGKAGADDFLQRLDARLDLRASTSLVIAATRAGTDAVAGMFRPSGRKSGVVELPDAPSVDPDAAVRRQLNEIAAQGLIRFNGDEVTTTIRWQQGQLAVNGVDMSMLRDLARGFAR